MVHLLTRVILTTHLLSGALAREARLQSTMENLVIK